MSVNWITKITVTNLAEKRVKVSGTRVDGADVKTYSFDTVYNRSNETIGQFQNRLGSLLWQQHLAATAKQTASAALIGASEEAVTAGLNAQEVA